MAIFQQTKMLIERNNLLSEGDSVLIGLSGGPDSVALLRLLATLRKRLRLSLAAVYVNHQLRPRAAAKEERFCQELCHRHAIDLTLVSEDIATLGKKRKLGIEEAAREFRYGLFEFMAEEDGHDRIALGHHADDQAETILFRIIRGTGPDGLAGIPVKRDKYIRPLLGVTKQDILDYLKKLGQAYCEDRSNRDITYSRNFIRQKLLPSIRERLNPEVDRSLLSLSEIAAAESQFLERSVDRAIRKAVQISPGGKFILDLHIVCSYDDWLRRRLLRRCVRKLSGTASAPSREVIERLSGLVQGRSKAVSLPDGLRAVRVDDRLVLRAARAGSFEHALKLDGRTRVSVPALSFRTKLSEYSGEPVDKARRSKRVEVDWDRIEPPLTVRSVRPGDRFQPLGLAGTKKVGNYLTDCKVPTIFRDETVLVCDQIGIVWLVGYEIDERVKITRGTRKVLSIEYGIRKQSSGKTI
jgi:tRNA(Ile)-lysidine synthase